MGIQNPPYQIVGPVVIGGPVTITNGPVTLQNGQFLAPDGSAAAPSYSFGSDDDTGIFRGGSGTVGFGGNATHVANIGTTGLTLNVALPIQWGSSGLASPDARIARAAAGSFTFSNASTNSFTVTAGASGLATFGGGIVTGSTISSGAAIGLAATQPLFWLGRAQFSSGDASSVTLANNGATNSVTLTVGASNLLTLNGGLATGGTINSSGVFQSTQNGGVMRYGSSGDGIALLQNSATNSFNRLQFGGTTSSFPAIKRNGTGIGIVLADDSGFTNIKGKLTTETNYTAGAIVPTGYLTLYDATGTAYRVPCVV